jgi:hypothetical protein
MSQWYRVFGINEAQPEPAALLEHLHLLGLETAGHFHGDDQGWFRAELVLDEDTEPILLERFWSKEDDLRAELNTWAAWLETVADNPHHGRLMEHVIRTTQLFTLDRPIDSADDSHVEQLCLEICRFLARQTDGVYQIDHQGFFALDGTLLVREE